MRPTPDPSPETWLVAIEGRRVRVIGGAPSEDEAMHLAEEEVTRLHAGWSDRWSPWETEADGTHHASLKDGRELVCYPPVKGADTDGRQAWLEARRAREDADLAAIQGNRPGWHAATRRAQAAAGRATRTSYGSEADTEADLAEAAWEVENQ